MSKRVFYWASMTMVVVGTGWYFISINSPNFISTQGTQTEFRDAKPSINNVGKLDDGAKAVITDEKLAYTAKQLANKEPRNLATNQPARKLSSDLASHSLRRAERNRQHFLRSHSLPVLPNSVYEDFPYKKKLDYATNFYSTHLQRNTSTEKLLEIADSLANTFDNNEQLVSLISRLNANQKRTNSESGRVAARRMEIQSERSKRERFLESRKNGKRVPQYRGVETQTLNSEHNESQQRIYYHRLATIIAHQIAILTIPAKA